MNIIRFAIERPIAIISGIIMILIFGWLALQLIPIQLVPDVNRPIISVETQWPGASPAEVEREIVNRQEEVLRGIDSLREMTSRSRNNGSEIYMEFDIDQDRDRTLLSLANRLDRVVDYPEEVERPSLVTASSEDSPIAWFVVSKIEESDRAIWTYGDFLQDRVRDFIERVPGVSRVNIFGGVEREMQIIIDPLHLSSHGLMISDIVSALREANTSITAGTVKEGKRYYIVRTEGDLNSIERIRSVVVHQTVDQSSGRMSRVTIADIADVRLGYQEERARIRRLGQPVLAFNIIRETGANVIETMSDIRTAIDLLNESLLPAENLAIEQVYDETVYIDSAIDLVQNNIVIGGSLAAFILFIFLRTWRATLVVSIAIPVSVIGTFVAMAAFGRSLNVVSLAGIAFAIGMVVDAAIVVLDNIDRLHRQGLTAKEAAYQGTIQVWSAVLVAALTTVMAFIPILTTSLEIGQLFRDIAVAISVSVLLSLLVAMTLIPAMSAHLLRSDGKTGPETGLKHPLRTLITWVLRGIDFLVAKIMKGILAQTRFLIRWRVFGLTIVGIVTFIMVIVVPLFLPKLEYLPEGNRNFVLGLILPPPGYNLDTTDAIAQRVETALRPYWATETGPTSLPGEPPKIKHFFFVVRRNVSFLGATSIESNRVAELIPVMTAPMFTEPGTFGFMTQPSIFGRGIGGGRLINLDILGNSLEEILEVAIQATALVSQAMPRSQGHQFRPIPGLEFGAPEIRLFPDQIRLADSGVTSRELGETVDVFNDGLRVAEIMVDGKRLDLILMSPRDHITQTQDIATLPIITNSGTIIPLSSLAEILLTAGPTEIRHKNRSRSVTLEIRPSPEIPLETALETLQTEVIDVLNERDLPPDIRIALSGTADKLTETWDALVGDLILAIVIVYLVMVVLFESFWYPLIILFAVPVAAAGGIGGLALLNTYQAQPLDMLTMLGFVILIGIVVNNAILLVDQSLYLRRHHKMPIQEAILLATRNRIRPIFMSTLTSLFGMLPLILFPGSGSELYRGLGSVVVGGLGLSSLLTLTLIPPLLGVLMPILDTKPEHLKEHSVAQEVR